MTSSSVNNPLVVEVSERERSQFKKNPFKSFKDDLNGALSFVPYDVLHVDDVRAYIPYNIEETDNEAILALYNQHLWDKNGNLKLKYVQLQRKGFM